MNGTEKIFVLGFWCGSEWMGREFRHKMDEACERYRNQTEEVRQEYRTELRRHADELTQFYEEQWSELKRVNEEQWWGIEEKFEQLDSEWRRKYEERENQWKQHLHDFAERISGEITKVVSYAVASAVRDLETANKICRAIRAGFARLRAIDAAAEVERNPGAPLSSYVRRQEEKSCQSTSATCCVSPGEKNEACLIE
jgi:hypothetical protein